MLLKAHGVLEADFFHQHVEYKYKETYLLGLWDGGNL
jgi:hypothetical protein